MRIITVSPRKPYPVLLNGTKIHVPAGERLHVTASRIFRDIELLLVRWDGIQFEIPSHFVYPCHVKEMI